MSYNPKCKHTNNDMLSLVGVENKQQKMKRAGVSKITGTSEFVLCAYFNKSLMCIRCVPNCVPQGDKTPVSTDIIGINEDFWSG